MRKSFRPFLIVWAVLWVLFNLIILIIPEFPAAGYNKFGGAFWAGYLSINFAFIAHIIILGIAFKAPTPKKLFYNIPLVGIGYASLIATMILGTILMAIPSFSYWLATILGLVMFVIILIATVVAKEASDYVSNYDTVVKGKTFFIKSLTVDAQNLMSRASTDFAKAECKKVYEAIRYSDPMSDAGLAAIESKIREKFYIFSDAVIYNQPEQIKTTSRDLLILVNDRNNQCKWLKQ